ncbi:hypothetical protein SAMN05421856_10522 [Chryseobacterium taichungense]|uniref:Uncharacterized protein n=1 Tax=Chryseobacterium taichungense TaxID=295069 RepID=A0A1H8A153_9FLAO|nr:hypothetical protein [Chryseobacterium taichungense]SEM64226.1 hypothetical protein SAMN05421856_10522 [Chryseobacterium taichungense]
MSQKRILIIFLIISIIIVLCNNVFFNDISELMPKSNEIGNILSNLSLAYIASYIFYLVVVKYQENKDKRNIFSTVYNLSCQLIGRGNSVVTTLASANNCLTEDLTKKITKEEYIKLCKNTNPKTIHPTIVLGTVTSPISATYSQLIYNNSYINAKALIENIFVYMPFLESDFIKLLNKLNESNFYLMADVLANPIIFKNTDFENMADAMYEFHLILREIEIYIEKHYKKYIK